VKLHIAALLGFVTYIYTSTRTWSLLSIISIPVFRLYPTNWAYWKLGVKSQYEKSTQVFAPTRFVHMATI
jgi:hypothetical protein